MTWVEETPGAVTDPRLCRFPRPTRTTTTAVDAGGGHCASCTLLELHIYKCLYPNGHVQHTNCFFVPV